MAINYDPGWPAEANGRSVRLRPDGLGFILIEPQCSGACEVELHWSSGWEPSLAILAMLITASIAIAWLLRGRFRRS